MDGHFLTVKMTVWTGSWVGDALAPNPVPPTSLGAGEEWSALTPAALGVPALSYVRTDAKQSAHAAASRGVPDVERGTGRSSRAAAVGGA